MTDTTSPLLDIIGIGLGPFNLSLAALLDEHPQIQSRFFEYKPRFDWHPGLMMEDCTLQVPMMADLTTMANPTNRFTYLNYLHQTDRLYNFYFYEEFLIPRADYNQYCRWVTEQLSNLNFGHRVEQVNTDDNGYVVKIRDSLTQKVTVYRARNLVFGTGSIPSVPSPIKNLGTSNNWLHSSGYLTQKSELQKSQSITVIGSGQSAAEIVLDLLNEQTQFDYEINWLTRSDGFLPMEYSKLGLEHFSPDYIDYFHNLPERTRDQIRSRQDLWYKGISDTTIGEIYDRIYKRTIAKGDAPITLQARSNLVNASFNGQGLKLEFEHLDQKKYFTFQTDKLVLATGHQHPQPTCLSPLMPLLEKDQQGRLCVNRDYTLASREALPGNLYIQNGEIHSHGIGAPDLGLGAYRSAMIINHLLGKEHYRIKTRNVFQNFGVAEKWQSEDLPEQKIA